MSGQDLFLELMDKKRILERALGELGKRGRAKAKAEQLYRETLAELQLVKRADGLPATIIGDVCRGDKKVAKLKLDRDVAEVDYTANLEAINVYKIIVRILENQIEREWRG